MKSKLKMIIRFFTNSELRIGYLSRLGIMNWITDKKFLEIKYKSMFHKKLNIDFPNSFNEKLQWLKVYNRKPEYTIMVDKYKVREYIAEKIGEKYLIPLIGVWDDVEKIDFDALPQKFVLKCNHNSGTGMCICTDSAQLNIQQVKREIKKGLKEDYYFIHREWPYKNVQRKIIAEQYMKSDEGGLTDYKIHCFNGVPKIILVCKDRFTESGLTEDFFSAEWQHLNICRPTHPNSKKIISKPEELEELLVLAKQLSEGIPFLRVDFYIIEHRIYFSELTFFPASGFEQFVPEEWDVTLGTWLELPKSDFI